ncbi:MAG: glycerate kinase, partial [Nitrososphaerales archaeon]
TRFLINELALDLDLNKFDRIIVVGGGKASGGLAEVLDSMIPRGIDVNGLVIVVEGTSRNYKTPRIQLLEASHPLPDIRGEKATQNLVSLLSKATPHTLVLCLISGGGSALMTLPSKDISLFDKIETTKVLLKSGAGIEEVNCVRKHLSRIKGGQLVRYSNGALLVSLIISDIIGNPVGSIASGPTAPDPSTFTDALKILTKHNIETVVPRAAFDHLSKGAMGLFIETPKPNDSIFSRVTNYILGDNAVACEAAVREIKKVERFRVLNLGSSWHGEAKDLGENIAGLCVAVHHGTAGVKKPVALVWGGETTVTIRGSGKGGRNQEEALAALNFLKERFAITIAFIGTDGVEGFKDAAGAIIDSNSRKLVEKMRVEIENYLSNNDSNSFFKSLKTGLIVTGLTGTNVNDIGIALIE